MFRRLLRAAVVVLFVVFVVATAGATYNHLALKRDASQAVDATLATERYDHLELTALTVEYNSEGLFGEPTTVTVVLSRTSNRNAPDIDEAVRDRLAARTNTPVLVRVHITDFHQTSSRREERLASPAVATRLAEG